MLLLAVQATAAERRLAIVELSTPPTMVGLGAQVVSEIESAALAQGFVAITPQQLQATLGETGWRDLKGCFSEVACVVKRLQGVNATHVVFGSLDRDDRAYLLKLALVDLSTGTVISDVDRAILIASRRFRQDVGDAVPRMMRGEREARGTLRITATVPEAQVFIDDRPVGVTPVELELKPGKYEVRLEKSRHLAVRRLVSVEANARSEQEFRLLRQPGSAADDEPLPPLDGPAVASKPGALPKIPATAIVAAAVGAVALGAGAWFGTQAQRTENDLQMGLDESTGRYAGTRADALEGRQQARIANVLFAVGGAALLGSVGLTVLHNRNAEATLSATIVPGGAGARIEARF